MSRGSLAEKSRYSQEKTSVLSPFPGSESGRQNPRRTLQIHQTFAICLPGWITL
jgi:hypothetical protein